VSISFEELADALTGSEADSIAVEGGFALDDLRKAMLRGIEGRSGGDKHKMRGLYALPKLSASQ
jgi:hypothetical protein